MCIRDSLLGVYHLLGVYPLLSVYHLLGVNPLLGVYPLFTCTYLFSYICGQYDSFIISMKRLNVIQSCPRELTLQYNNPEYSEYNKQV